MGRSGQDPHGFHYYNSLVRVECGDKEGCFTGGHYDRRGYDSDLHIICSCSDCQAQSAFTRILCRHWEEHAGKASSKKWIESIKAVSKDGNRQSLRKWIAKECTKIGAAIVGHKLRVWRPTSCQYHSGTVQKFNAGIFEHVIAYEDGTEEALWLAVESYEDMGMDPGWHQPSPPPSRSPRQPLKDAANSQLHQLADQAPPQVPPSALNQVPAKPQKPLASSKKRPAQQPAPSSRKTSSSGKAQMLARSASTAALSNPLEQAGPQSSNPATAGDSGVEQPLAATLSQEDSAQEQMDDMQEDAPQAHAQHAQPAPILLGADLAERPSVGQPPVPNQHSARGPNSSAVLQPRPHAGSPMRLAADRQMSATHEPPDQSNPPAPGPASVQPTGSKQAKEQATGLSLEEWKDIFNEANICKLAADQMYRKLRDILRSIRNGPGTANSFASILAGKYNSQGPQERSTFVTNLFKGCAEVIVDAQEDGQDMEQAKQELYAYFKVFLVPTQ